MDMPCNHKKNDWGGVAATLAVLACWFVDVSTMMGTIVVALVGLAAMVEFLTGRISTAAVSLFEHFRSK